MPTYHLRSDKGRRAEAYFPYDDRRLLAQTKSRVAVTGR
jgi:hypothetical protein